MSWKPHTKLNTYLICVNDELEVGTVTMMLLVLVGEALERRLSSLDLFDLNACRVIHEVIPVLLLLTIRACDNLTCGRGQ